MDGGFSVISGDHSIESILFRFPELRNAGIGPHKITALQVAVAFTKNGVDPNLKELIKSDIKNINVEDAMGRTPLFYAVMNENIELLEYLLKSGAHSECQFKPLTLSGPTNEDLKWRELLGKKLPFLDTTQIGWTPLHIAVKKGCISAVKILIEKGAKIDFADDNNISPLILAFSIISISNANSPEVLYNSKECLKILLDKRGHLDDLLVDKKTIFNEIITKVPRPAIFLKELFDLKIIDTPAGKTLYFNVLFVHNKTNSHDAKNVTFQEMKLISSILALSNKLQKGEILQHPLVETFLLYKWRKIRKFFLGFLCSYLIFVLSLSSFILMLRYQINNYSAIITLNYFLIGTSAILSFHAIMQFAIIPKRIFQEFEMWLNAFATVTSLIISIVGIINKYEDGMPDWLLHISSFTVFIAWTQLMLLMGRFPIFGNYAIMFSCVLQNVVQVLFTFSCLIFGFAISFAIQFRQCDDFANPWFAVVKTVVMMMGEYDYVNLFAPNQSNNLGEIKLNGDLEECAYLDGTSRIIFVVFIVLVSIVLMNLMIGVAVSDIQEVKRTGHVKRLKKQAEFFRQVEVYSVKFFLMGKVPGWIQKIFNYSVPHIMYVHPDDEQVLKILSNRDNYRSFLRHRYQFENYV